MQLCARPGCWKAATRTVRLHQEDKIGVIHVCEEDANVLSQMAKDIGVPVKRND